VPWDSVCVTPCGLIPIRPYAYLFDFKLAPKIIRNLMVGKTFACTRDHILVLPKSVASSM